MNVLEDKIAIVTGASRGIGRAIALRLARAGASVVICARTEGLLVELKEEIEHLGSEARVVALDLRLEDSGERVVDAAIETFGAVDIVVNNAGATKRGRFESLTNEDWADGFALKFFGAVRLTRAAWPHLKDRKGSIVNIAGSGGRTPGPEFTIGGSVNAAMLSFTKALADAGLPDGIQVNAINPGPVRTARFDKRLAETAAVHNVDLTQAMKIFVREERIMKIGEPEDIAELALFLLSTHGRLLHGSLIDADGGLTKTL